MTTQEYDQLEKIFNGSWKFDRDENRKAWMDAAETPAELRKMAEYKPVLILTREGSSFRFKTVMTQGLEFEYCFKLNEVLDWKEKEEDPQFHYRILALYKDGVLTQDVTPMKPNSGKRHISKTSVKGDELTIELSLAEGSNVTAKRIYKKC